MQLMRYFIYESAAIPANGGVGGRGHFNSDKSSRYCSIEKSFLGALHVYCFYQVLILGISGDASLLSAQSNNGILTDILH